MLTSNYCHQNFFSFFQMRKKLENLASFREHISAHANAKIRKGLAARLLAWFFKKKIADFFIHR